MRLHLNKPGIRALGVAESFKEDDLKSRLAGVVMRSDLVIDGFVLGTATVGGDDATSSVVKMIRALRRNDVNLIILSGCIISMYNIVDVDAVSKKTESPVICLTYKESRGIERAIKHHFTESRTKLASYRSLGERHPLKLRSGYRVYVRASGVTDREAEEALNLFTLQGSIPEPVRVAKLLARAVRA
jgi:endonuclease V-like protein UPF0215 family